MLVRNLQRLREVRYTSDWKRLSGEFKGRKVKNGISGVDGRVCEELLGRRDIDTVYLYAEWYIQGPIFDCMIEIDEMIEVLNGLNDGRAPGEDQIPLEFF